jgi:hypothetical protein
MEWRSDGVLPPANPFGSPANDVDLLIAIEGVLTSGCTGRAGGETATLTPSPAAARTAVRSGLETLDRPSIQLPYRTASASRVRRIDGSSVRNCDVCRRGASRGSFMNHG